jgi:hypothetical protein
MRIVDIYILGANLWLIALWIKHGGPDWIALVMAILFVAGCAWIQIKRNAEKAGSDNEQARPRVTSKRGGRNEK